MSAWGKFFAPITVPTGGWDIRLSTITPVWYTITVPAGTYDTILHLLDELTAQAADIPFLVKFLVTSTGIVSIQYDMVLGGIDWGATDDDLEAVLGLDGTETVIDYTITANNPHQYGWYPGIITRGATLGEGLAYDDRWQPVDVTARTYAGSGAVRLIGPSRLKYDRRLRFGAIHADEVWHKSRGPICLGDRWAYNTLYWYMDRDLGIRESTGTWVATYYGVQLDPGHNNYHNDGSSDFGYYIVSVNEAPLYTILASHPDWFSVDLSLNAEPA